MALTDLTRYLSSHEETSLWIAATATRSRVQVDQVIEDRAGNPDE